MKTLFATLFWGWMLCHSVGSQPGATEAIVPVTLCQLTENAYLYKDRPVQLKATLLALYFGEALIGLMLTDDQCVSIEAFFNPASDAEAILAQMRAQGTRELDVTVTGKLRDVEGKSQYGPFAMLHFQLIVKTIAANKPLAQPPTTVAATTAPNDFQRGVERYEKGDLTGALSAFEQAIKTLREAMQAAANSTEPKVESPGTDPATLYYWRGLVRYDRREWDRARSDFEQAIRYNPRHLLALIKRGNTCMNQGEHEEAIRAYNKAIMLDPKSPLVWNNRGLAWLNRAELDFALNDFNHALELDPRLVAALSNRAGVKHDQRDFAGALRDYDEAIQLAPELALPYNNRGVTRNALNDRQGALRDYNRAIELRPGFRQAYLNRSRVLLKLGSAEEAMKDLQRSEELSEEAEGLLEPQPFVSKTKPPIQ